MKGTVRDLPEDYEDFELENGQELEILGFAYEPLEVRAGFVGRRLMVIYVDDGGYIMDIESRYVLLPPKTSIVMSAAAFGEMVAGT